ncbi:NAD(P)-dependent oxidoreductase [Xanthocytophaga agilis]|uniref:NAD(P)-dependent oxidoreductase n=1 Tax=Xanthocytophaga agilis TaxID=3048010 RepID=A0AAE3UFQ2_9BACT|nr:NAD(P)-dependent oxidoreductase [Xanthocytophaga agilis]MDJ1501557.1 NAD(P)-dependent oxidoreductase [Xanthocytophaga agilis]
MSTTSTIAVLGLGAMGSRMAKNLIKAGHRVIVWNRTPQATIDLVKEGATQANSPKEAAAQADFVLAMVRDDEASRQVWLDPENGALQGMKKEAIAIESSTVTPVWIKELAGTLTAKGISFLEAPVSGSRPQADAAQLVFFVGGDHTIFTRTEPILKAMGSTIQYVGPWGSGALVKLTTNALLGIQVTAYAELIGMLKRSGMDAQSALAAISKTSVWSPVAGYLTSTMLTENFTPQFPVELIEKDFSYILTTAGSSESAPMTDAALHVFQKAIAQNLGQENMTSVVRMFTK